MTDKLWEPSAVRKSRSNLARFLQWVRGEIEPGVYDWNSLYSWSVVCPQAFWPAVWRFCGIQAQKTWTRILVDGDCMPGARWFEGARLNFAENLLQGDDEILAIIAWDERGRRVKWTYQQLRADVARLAASLRSLGLKPGDRVAGYLPNIAETVVAMLAAASLGAIWSTTSPDFGVQGALDRFTQITPRILFTADGYLYNGKPHDSLQKAAHIARAIPSIESVIVIPHLDADPVISEIPHARLWTDLVDPWLPPPELKFESLPFDHPLYILYSSGTTGVPKCILHGAGGTLIQHLKELVLHCDLQPSHRIFYFTTCGWMMWNWLASSLAAQATLVLYDGSPFYPSPTILWDIAQTEHVSIFGAGAKYYASIEKAGVAPARTHQLSQLKTILSTGSPLPPESFDYIYHHVHRDVQLASISGGTDLISCFALGNPLAPVFRGELQTRGLGMAVDVFDENGRSLVDQKGELVCTRPFPSMPLRFWNDPDDRLYRRTYFERYPNVWHHGDWVELNRRGGMVFHGRSDAVLNPGGVRIGTAEIYRQVEQLDEILESITVGQDWQNDVRIILFVKLRPDLTLTEELKTRIRQRIRDNCTPRHVPALIIQVADIPRTKSGKITELAVRNVIHNRPVNNTDALMNPESLDLYRNLPELAPH